MAANSAPTTQWVQRRQACDGGQRMAKRWKAARKDCAWQPSDQTQVLLELSREVREVGKVMSCSLNRRSTACVAAARPQHTHTRTHTHARTHTMPHSAALAETGPSRLLGNTPPSPPPPLQPAAPEQSLLEMITLIPSNFVHTARAL